MTDDFVHVLRAAAAMQHAAISYHDTGDPAEFKAMRTCLNRLTQLVARIEAKTVTNPKG